MAKAQAQGDDYAAATSLTDLKRMFDESRTGSQEARLHSVIDIDYYDGKQLTSGEKLALSKRGQPDIVINRIKPAVNGILGVVGRGKSEPRAFPRTPKDEGSADAATDVLRYIADFNRFNALKAQVFKDILVPGSGAALIGANADRMVTIEQIRWEEFFFDPRSRRNDFKDARFMGIAKWMYADDVSALYPGKRDSINSAIDSAPMMSADESYQDRPNWLGWVDRRQRRLMVVELYYRKVTTWKRCVFHSGEILEDGESPYLDAKGYPDNPIEAQSAYVDRMNQRYGAVRDMLGPQDEINKRRSKALHMLSTRQIQESQPGAAMVKADDARKEAARPDGVIPSGWQVVPGLAQLQGQIELLQEAKSEIERLGPNPAVLGREGTDSSGRALLARQQAGMVELDVLFGGLEDWELRVYRQCWARAKQYFTAPMFIRVTDDEGSPQFVGLNQPKGPPVIDPQTGQQAEHSETGEPMEGDPQFHPALVQDPFTGQPAPHPQAGQSVLGYKNMVAEMDVDIIIDTTPDTATLQQEQYQDLLQMVSASPLYQQQVPFTALVKLSAIPHKKDVLDSIEQAGQAGQQAQQQQQQFAQDKQQADLALIASQIELNKARASHAQITGEVAGAKGLLDANEAGQASAKHEPHQHNSPSQPDPEESGEAA